MNLSLIEIVETIGLPEALQLIKAVGGTRIYLPQPDAIDAEHWLAKTIGVEPARRLAIKWAGERPMLPRAFAYLKREMRRRIRAEKAEYSVRQLALRYKTSERAIYLILAEEPAGEDRQKALF